MIKKLQKDRTIFCEFLGYSPETKILELLLEGRENEYTFNDIVNALGVNRKRAYEILNMYLKVGIVKESNRVKHITFYRLNKNEMEVKTLIKLFDTLLDRNSF